MKIAVVGKGNVGGGLADLWKKAGHDIVARVGKEGGDVSEADVVLVAVPGGAVADALDGVQGISGKTVIDATNLIGTEPPSGFASKCGVCEVADEWADGEVVQPQLCESVRQAGRGEVAAKQPLVGRREGARCRWASEPRRRLRAVRLGTLDEAATQEHGTAIIFAVAQEIGPFFYRFAPPEQL